MVKAMVHAINDYSIEEITRITGATPLTARRWKDGTSQPPASALRLLRLMIEGELMSREWEGFRFKDDLLYIPGWNRGFSPGELRAMFFRIQQVSALESEKRRLQKDLDNREKALDELKRQRDFYRSQLVMESRYGLMLSAI